MSQSVRVTRNARGGFNLWHWGKYLGWREDQTAAEQEAKERSDKLKLMNSLKQMARADRNRPEKPSVKPEDVGTWREDGRDPNQPQRGWITHYKADGRTTKGWYWIPPGHPFHWTHKYRRKQTIVGDRTILPSLPQIPSDEKLKPCRDSSSDTPENITSPENQSPAAPSGPAEIVAPPAAVFTAPTPTFEPPASSAFDDLDLWQQIN